MNLGSEYDTFRLWVSEEIIKRFGKEEGCIKKLDFPIPNSVVETLKIGKTVLKPSEEYNTFLIYFPQGYGCEISYRILNTEEPKIYYFPYGRPEGCLVSVKSEKIRYAWRKIKTTEGITTIYADRR